MNSSKNQNKVMHSKPNLASIQKRVAEIIQIKTFEVKVEVVGQREVEETAERKNNILAVKKERPSHKTNLMMMLRQQTEKSNLPNLVAKKESRTDLMMLRPMIYLRQKNHALRRYSPKMMMLVQLKKNNMLSPPARSSLRTSLKTMWVVGLPKNTLSLKFSHHLSKGSARLSTSTILMSSKRDHQSLPIWRLLTNNNIFKNF